MAKEYLVNEENLVTYLDGKDLAVKLQADIDNLANKLKSGYTLVITEKDIGTRVAFKFAKDVSSEEGVFIMFTEDGSASEQNPEEYAMIFETGEDDEHWTALAVVSSHLPKQETSYTLNVELYIEVEDEGEDGAGSGGLSKNVTYTDHPYNSVEHIASGSINSEEPVSA